MHSQTQRRIRDGTCAQSHTHTSERCVELQMAPGEAAFMSACLIVWQTYVRIHRGANTPGREGRRERETERSLSFSQRGWMKREEEEGLEHPLYKNRAGE